jgi:hypothetical protein
MVKKIALVAIVLLVVAAALVVAIADGPPLEFNAPASQR